MVDLYLDFLGVGDILDALIKILCCLSFFVLQPEVEAYIVNISCRCVNFLSFLRKHKPAFYCKCLFYSLDLQTSRFIPLFAGGSGEVNVSIIYLLVLRFFILSHTGFIPLFRG